MACVGQEPTGWQRTLLMIGAIGPLGHLPASGTVTVAVVGIPLYWIMYDWHWVAYAAATLAFTGASIWLHHAGDRILGEKDSRRLVWDELVGFLFAVAFLPFTWQLIVVAFLLERVIDIVKVPPADWIEKSWPGGLGVVGDDVVAGLYTCGIAHGLVWLAPTWAGVSS
jgi:phosphatidylglycerophosphatase A